MSENIIYSLTEVEGGVIVTEFVRGNQTSITIEDYIAKGNDIKDLFTEFFNKHPEKTSGLVFGDTDDPAFGSILYQNATIDVFEKKDLKSLVSGEEKFLGIVTYQDIFYNTKESDPTVDSESDASEPETEAADDVQEKGLRGLINRNKVATALIMVCVLIVALTLGIFLTKTKPPKKFEVNDDLIAQYLTEKKEFLSTFQSKYGKNPQSARFQIQRLLDELNKISESDKELSTADKADLALLLKVAKKYKDSLD